MRIDHGNGGVTLPSGLAISPALTQDSFRALPAFQGAQQHDYGTLPWIHYHFSGGRVEGHELLVSLCYYDQLLVYVSMTADLYPPGPKDWSQYSLDVEAATKEFQDRLLVGMFGKPSESGSFLLGGLSKGRETLERPLRWDFPWGSVFSAHDSKGGGTAITVRYGDRLEQASRAYAQRSAGG
jgi:hypothetical protein